MSKVQPPYPFSQAVPHAPAHFSRQACQLGGKAAAAARRAKRETQRARVLELAAQGRSCRDIAQIVGVPKSTVNDWIREVGVKSQGRRGRPRGAGAKA